METIVIASPVPAFLGKLEQQIPPELRSSATLTRVNPGPGFLDFLRYEIPDLVILHVPGDPAALVPVFEGLEEDPWLDSIGFVLVVPDPEAVVELYQGFNVAAVLADHEVERRLGRVIRLLAGHRDFLNYDGIIKKLTALSGDLVLETDLMLVPYYSGLFSHYLFKEGLVDRSKRYAVKLTLEELLMNAMEHGNAGITFEEKTQLQEAGGTVTELVEQRMAQPPWKDRKVTLSYRIGPLSSQFVITDEGEGFDTSRLATKAEVASPDLAHGRGIFLSQHSADGLVYNPKGNVVTVDFSHNGAAERTIPPGFVQTPPRTFDTGEVVFWERATGDHIYYIVSGEYDVSVGGKKVARLTPNDVFMGEMSFLLGNRRTATVIAATGGKLVEISRQAFTEAVKQYPNYGIFLSKMLARRLRDVNRFQGS